MTAATDVQHEMLLIALRGELHTSGQLSPKATILDVGTGTGTWACQIASHHPESRVYGIDLHQVTPKNIPQNVVFETVDVMTGFPFNTGTFDLVHSRLLLGGITDWSSYLENLLRITKRGGSVECVELELRPQYHGEAGHESIDHWTQEMANVLESSKLCPNIAGHLERQMCEAGFTDVRDTIVETPIGPWPSDKEKQEIGRLAMSFSEQHMVQWLSSVLLKVGRDRVDIESKAARVIEELSSPDLQAYFRWHFVTGKKCA